MGAGSSGPIIASRLSEDGHNILLIEAGGMPPFFLNVPVITPALQESVYDWRYVTTPQIQACKGLSNNVGHSINLKKLVNCNANKMVLIESYFLTISKAFGLGEKFLEEVVD